jgi:murein L,D-transpeptidase YcbB/YkuD
MRDEAQKRADFRKAATLEYQFANTEARLHELEELLATERQRAIGMTRLVVQYLRTVQGTPNEYNRRLEQAERIHAYTEPHAFNRALHSAIGRTDLRAAISGLETELTEISRHTDGLYQLMEHLKQHESRQYADFTNEHKAMVGALVHQLSMLSARIEIIYGELVGTYVR